MYTYCVARSLSHTLTACDAQYGRVPQAPAMAALAAPWCWQPSVAVVVWTPSPPAARPMAACQPPGAAAARGYALEESFLSLCIASERVGGWLDTIRGPSSRPRCGSKAQLTCLLPWSCECRLTKAVQYLLQKHAAQAAQGACGAGRRGQ